MFNYLPCMLLFDHAYECITKHLLVTLFILDSYVSCFEVVVLISTQSFIRCYNL